MTLAAALSPATHSRSLTQRVASQGSLLFAGFAAAQIFSFLRNAIFASTLSKGDFGIAASLMLVLQLVESMTDVGADRLIVQAPDGDAPRFVATAHTILIGRGVITTLILFAASGPFCRFLGIDEAQRAFEFIALVPLIKGFSHLDARRAQRGLNSRPQMMTEVVPQFIGLVLTLPALMVAGDYWPSYWAVAALALAQAAAGLATSHVVAERPYFVAADGPVLRQLIAFGWPIWLSALPLCAVYQGDRLLIGKLYGMEALAGYSVAFLVTMVPGLIAAKVGHALILPLLASQRANGIAFCNRFASLCAAASLTAALYLIVVAVAGGGLIPLAFGAKYEGLGALTAWLALMWTVRMVQVVPGMAVMAHGETRPFLTAGVIRACALPAALLLALNGYSVEALAAAGAMGELASLAYIVWRSGKCHPHLPAVCARSTLWLVGVAAIVAVAVTGLAAQSPADHTAAALVLAAFATAYAVTAHQPLRDGLVALMPGPTL